MGKANTARNDEQLDTSGGTLQQHLQDIHAERKEHLQAEQRLEQVREEYQASEPAPGSGMNTEPPVAEEIAKPDGPQAMAAPGAAAAEVTTQVTVVVLFLGL